jgi:DNA polymerase III sliding clamp (beta) subunit (PCNA family)
MTTRLDLEKVGEIRFSATDNFIDINVSVNGDYSGPVKYIAVSAEKLLLLLNQVDYGEITLAIHDSKRSIVITTSEDEGYKALLMPLATN